jgi:hypothetical protein
MENAGLIISAGGLAVVIITAACTIVWRVSRVELSVRDECGKEIDEVRKENVALQAKVYQVEIWARDEFVRKGSFETVVTRLEKGMELLGNKIEGAVDKMAAKIEKISHD